MYGFLKKRSKGKIKYFYSRWFFLISSRPLVIFTFSLYKIAFIEPRRLFK